MGVLTPLAIVPHQVLVEFGDNMNFLQRLFNVFISFGEMLVKQFWYMPRMQKIAEKYFANITGNCFLDDSYI
jgi:glucuronosyltransferase